MRVAHMCVITPGRCGLYETSREMVVGLRQLGVDSRLVEPTPAKATYNADGRIDGDRGAPFAGLEWAVEADVIVNHSGYDSTPVEKTKQPVVHVAHGRPRSSFLSEAGGSTPIYSYWLHKSRDPRFAAIVTLWPQHKPYLQVMFPGKPVHVVQASVDLEAWSPKGPAGYSFHGNKGFTNIVCTDPFRDDVDCFVPLNAAALFGRMMRDTKIHVYAKPKKSKGWDALLQRIKQDGNLGEVCGWVGGLDNVYRAATMMLTANTIDTRSVREAMACGCPVVRVPDLEPGWEGRVFAGILADRGEVRKEAERRFHPEETAKQMKAVLDGIGH